MPVVLALLLLGGAARGQTVLTVARLPARTPAADTVFVAGSFNGWNPHLKAYALAKGADGRRRLTLPAAAIGPVEYKFTRGSWPTAEVDAQDGPLANRRATLGPAQELAHDIAGWADESGAAPARPRSTASPRVRVLVERFGMPQLGRERRVWVYLPADYARHPARRYPVLYLHDGQNVFDAATSYAGEWGVDETLDRLGDAAGIVVAVDNGGPFRSDEYIPWASDSLRGQPHRGGQGGAYVDFLARTLKPYVDAHFRTRPAAAHTGVAGSSLGGLISVYAALKYPRVFGRVGAFSPAFWVCQDSLRAYAATHPAAPTARFYFVCGPKESRTMLPLMRAWRTELRAEGVPATQLAFHVPADGAHTEWFWRREFPAAYRYLFGPAVPAASGAKKQPKRL